MAIYKLIGLLLFLTWFSPLMVEAQQWGGPQYVSESAVAHAFPLFVQGKTAPIVASKQDFKGVERAIQNLQADLAKVSQVTPELIYDQIPKGKKAIVLIGTLGKHPLIDQLVKNKKLNISDLPGKWETFSIQTINKPFPNIDQALVIVGSDKRGTIFGAYDVSSQIGVSPWHWWADVPVRTKSALYIKPGAYTQGEPKVKYRGIFINDEAPALSGWTKEKFDGFKHGFYEKVFELILRLKGNFLWPAMWGNAFYDDDPLNPVLADEYGVVISTSHHEPLMRAHDEWRRYGKGKWDYTTNDSTLREFWKQGIKRMGNNESVVTLAMRGDGDAPMTQGTAIELLERIVADQRQIIAEVTGKKPEATPQVWALYKEVQDYYDKGMRVPDDVTLLLCDDNWGNIRKLPKIDAKPHPGGYGIYYHFDYVGGPRNYKWLNTNPLPRIQEQMSLAYNYGARQIWVVNVGDIKPMEFPISFFLDLAWDPTRIAPNQVQAYSEQWAAQQFGNTHAKAIADLLAKYAKYNARRKPELLSPETYSILYHREAETVVKEYNALLAQAEKINALLPVLDRDAFYQLVLHPIQACANLNELYYTVALNRLYAKQGRSATNTLAEKAQALFQRDAEISNYYNQTLANGKWSHMMDQTHIGYTYWQQPNQNKIPELSAYAAPEAAKMGVAVEGNALARIEAQDPLVLPVFYAQTPQIGHYLDLFNQGKTSFTFQLQSPANYLLIQPREGKIEQEQRIEIQVDWSKAPKGQTRLPLLIKASTGQEISVYLDLQNSLPDLPNFKGFLETDGYVSMLAEHYTQAQEMPNIKWQILPDIGLTAGGITTTPSTANLANPKPGTPCLEYNFYSSKIGEVRVNTLFSPTLEFNESSGLRYGISIDDGPIQIINVHQDKSNFAWERSVANNIRSLFSNHILLQAGAHTLKYWAIDPGLVLQKLVIDLGGVKNTYLGPPESPRKDLLISPNSKQ